MYDNTGELYNVSRILSPQGTLDEEAYKGYSPLFISYANLQFSSTLTDSLIVAPHLPWHMA